MGEDMHILISRETWNLITLSVDACIIGCCWVYSVKYKPNYSIDRYKSRLVAKGFFQTYGNNYFETFSLVVRLNFFRILFSLVVNLD